MTPGMWLSESTRADLNGWGGIKDHAHPPENILKKGKRVGRGRNRTTREVRVTIKRNSLDTE